MKPATKQPKKEAKPKAKQLKTKQTELPEGKKVKRQRRRIKNPHAAGIDIGSQFHYVAVPPNRDQQTVRKFSAYTDGLEEMVKWLKKCRVTTVVMESTGVYWIAAYQMLEQNGFEVLLVDARSVKHVPGRNKTDVCDCQWLQDLHTYGLLSGAFRPADEICQLRTLQRHRKNLVESVSMRVQHIQKALNEMNLHLHHVLSDTMGESAQRILDAILAGQRDPAQLVHLVDKRVKKSPAEIMAALKGNYREEQLFVIRQTLASIRAEQQQIDECDRHILAQLETMRGPEKPPSQPPTEPAEQIKAPKQAPKPKRGRPKQNPKTIQ